MRASSRSLHHLSHTDRIVSSTIHSMDSPIWFAGPLLVACLLDTLAVPLLGLTDPGMTAYAAYISVGTSFKIGSATCDLWVCSIIRAIMYLFFLPIAANRAPKERVFFSPERSNSLWLGALISLGTMAFVVLKAIARLVAAREHLQPRSPDSTYLSLAEIAAEEPSPAEHAFWISLAASMVLCPAESALSRRLCQRVRRSSVAAVDVASEQPAGAKAETSAEDDYLHRTDPESVSIVRLCAGFLLYNHIDRLLLLAGLSLITASAGIAGWTPLVYAQMLHTLITYGPFDEFFGELCQYFAATSLMAVTKGLRSAIFLYIGARFSARLRAAFFRNMLRQELDFVNAAGASSLAARLAADVSLLGAQVSTNMNVVLAQSGQLCVQLGLMLSISWKLTLCAAVVVPLVVWFTGYYGSRLQQVSRKAQSALSGANASAADVLQEMASVKAFNTEAMHVREYTILLRGFVTHSAQLAWLTFLSSGLALGIVPNLGMCVVCYYAQQLTFTPAGCSHASADGPPTTLPCQLSGDLALGFLNLLRNAYGSLPKLSSTAQAMQAAMGSAELLLLWTVRPPNERHGGSSGSSGAEGVDHTGGLDPARTAGLAFVDVAFRYALRPERAVLDGLTLEVARGTKAVLVGPSGSGKSSAMLVFARLFTIDGGECLLDGQSVASYAIPRLRRAIGLVTQAPVLFSRSIRANICYGTEEGPEAPPSDEDVERAALLMDAESCILGSKDGYASKLGKGGIQLSPAEQQKIALARALCRSPSVLLLDDPTSAMDRQSEAKVLSNIDGLVGRGQVGGGHGRGQDRGVGQDSGVGQVRVGQGGLTVLHAPGRLSLAAGCDRIFVMADGIVAEQGTHDELMRAADAKPTIAEGGTFHGGPRRGIYATLVRAQELGGELMDDERRHRTSTLISNHDVERQHRRSTLHVATMDERSSGVLDAQAERLLLARHSSRSRLQSRGGAASVSGRVSGRGSMHGQPHKTSRRETARQVASVSMVGSRL